MKKTTVIEITTILYIILFLYTGISKLMDYSIFKEHIATSPLLAPIAKPIAESLPFVEFFVVILLTVPRWRLKGFYAALSLMMLFTIYIIGILSFDDQLPCSCGGVLAEMSWGQHIIFNCGFIAMAIIGIIFQKKMQKTNREQISSIALSA
jgi:uncharacterized membrane protein YphA (DoxX/SURF4 family)